MVKKDTEWRLASWQQQKIGASRSGESCICFPLCIIFPRGPPTIFRFTIRAVYLYSFSLYNEKSLSEAVSLLMELIERFYVLPQKWRFSVDLILIREILTNAFDDVINRIFSSLNFYIFIEASIKIRHACLTYLIIYTF